MPCKRPRCCKCKREQKPSQTPPQIGDINLGKLAAKAKWEMCAEFGEDGGPGGLLGALNVTATQSGEIAVADWSNNRVVICSNEGQHKATIPVQPTDPRAVAAIHNPEQCLLVVEEGSKYVKVFNMKDNKLAFQFTTVAPSQAEETQVQLESLAVRKNGTVLVGDDRRMVLTEHTCTCSPPKVRILCTIPVQTEPDYLAVDDDNDRIMVSGRYGRYEWRVDVLDGEGSSLFTIRPTINGIAACCFGIFCNSSGIYLVETPTTDNYLNGQIKHYGLDGGLLDCPAQCLKYPLGITITSNGKLVFADFWTIKIYSKVR